MLLTILETQSCVIPRKKPGQRLGLRLQKSIVQSSSFKQVSWYLYQFLQALQVLPSSCNSLLGYDPSHTFADLTPESSQSLSSTSISTIQQYTYVGIYVSHSVCNASKCQQCKQCKQSLARGYVNSLTALLSNKVRFDSDNMKVCGSIISHDDHQCDGADLRSIVCHRTKMRASRTIPQDQLLFDIGNRMAGSQG